MADTPNPRLAVTVDGTEYQFDFDRVTGRQLGVIETWCGIDFAAFRDGIIDGSHAAASAAVYVSEDQARGPLTVTQAVSAMDVVSIQSTVAFSAPGLEDEAAPPAKPVRARKKAA